MENTASSEVRAAVVFGTTVEFKLNLHESNFGQTFASKKSGKTVARSLFILRKEGSLQECTSTMPSIWDSVWPL